MAEWRRLQDDARHGLKLLRTEVGAAFDSAVRQGEILPLRLNLQRIEWSLRRSYQSLGRAVWKRHAAQIPSPSETAYEKIFSEIDLLLDEKKRILKKIDALEGES